MLPVTGEAGIVPSAMEEVPHVVAVVATLGRFGTPRSTADTRMSYVVPAVKPVSVASVNDALAVCAQFVHVDSAYVLYSTL